MIAMLFSPQERKGSPVIHVLEQDLKVLVVYLGHLVKPFAA